MHKWLALCLTCVMSCSMVACQLSKNSPAKPFGTPESNVTGQQDNEPTKTKSSDTTHSTGLQWEVREVVAPTVDNVKAQYFTVHNNTKAGVVISPWQSTDFDLESTKSSLQNSPLLDDWTIASQKTEVGHVTEYNDVGQMTGRQWIHSIIGSTSEERLISGEPDLSVEYHENTETTIGYTDIRFCFNIPEEKITREIQDQMYQLLKNVYGDEYAEFLCYAPNIEGSLLLEIKQDNAKIYFRRNITPSSITFSVQVVSRLYDDIFTSFPGANEYTPLIDVPKHMTQFVQPEFGDINLQEYRNIGAQMLQEYLPGYDGTVSDYSSSYTMKILYLNNNKRIESFVLNAMISQTDVNKLLSPDLIIDYTITYQDDNIDDAKFNLKCSAGQTDANIDAEYARTEFPNIAVKMLQCILADDGDIEYTFAPNQDGEYQQYQYQSKVCGIDKTVSIRFEMGTTMADKLVSYFYVSIT